MKIDKVEKLTGKEAQSVIQKRTQEQSSHLEVWGALPHLKRGEALTVRDLDYNIVQSMRTTIAQKWKGQFHTSYSGDTLVIWRK